MRLAIIGTGLMGAAMAKRFAAESPHEILLWNRTAERAHEVGVGRVCDTVGEAVAEAEVVITSLLDPHALREVFFCDHGAAAFAGGKLFIETSTAGADVLSELHTSLNRAGAALVDAPLLGSTGAVLAGSLLIPVGGAVADFESAKHVLAYLGDVMHVGPLGTAAKLKLLHNSLLAILTAAAAELLTASDAIGLDRRRTFEIFLRLAPYLERRTEGLRDHRYENTTFALKNLVKDLDLSLALYHQTPVSPHLTALTRELFAEAVPEFGELDMSAIVRRYEGPLVRSSGPARRSV